MNDKYEIVNCKEQGIYEVVCKGSKIHYYVNEHKGVVVAVMEDARQEFLNEMYYLIDKTLNLTYYEDDLFNNAQNYIKTIYKGKAQCMEQDDFSLEKGMEVARTHMLADYYIDRCIAFDTAYNHILGCLNEINKRYYFTIGRGGRLIKQSEILKARAENAKQ
jgi:hypothetical protein